MEPDATSQARAAPPWRNVAEVEPEGAISWAGAALMRCDPYLVWADVTTHADASETHPFPAIGVLIELERPEDRAWLIDECEVVPSGAEPASTAPTRFITGLVDSAGLRQLVAAVASRKLRRFTLQAARADLSRSQWQNYRLFLPTGPKGARTRLATKSPKANARSKASRPRGAPGQGPSYLGIIDDGLPFAQLATAARPRLRLWDQGWLPEYLRLGLDGVPAAPGTIPAAALGTEWLDPWDSPPLRGFFYGRRLDPARPIRPERELYAAAAYFDPPPTRSHGAGVLGRLAPWTSGRAAAAGDWPPEVSGLAMVQLPSLTVEDTSGGTLAMRVLDGLHFILWQEEASRRAGAVGPRPVVANVSYGVHAGPHDGSSMFEAAASEMLDRNPHLHLVLPAGNSHRARCHRQCGLAPQASAGDRCRMPWKLLPDNGRDTFMEIWIDAAANLRVEILPPGHTQALIVNKGEAKVYVAPANGAVQFAAIYPPSVAQGLNGTMVLIAVSPTRNLGDVAGIGLNQRPRRRVGAPHGLWQVTVVNQGAGATRFDAWIERGDAAPDSPRGDRQAFFVDSGVTPLGGHSSTPSGTLNGIATFCHPRLHVVGAMRELDGRLSDYSAAGPRRGDALRDQGPDVVVKADRSGHLPGLDTGGFMAGARTHLNGTSVACAVYANWLAVTLASNPAQWPAPAPPPAATPEVACAAELGPRALDAQRGQARRMIVP